MGEDVDPGVHGEETEAVAIVAVCSPVCMRLCSPCQHPVSSQFLVGVLLATSRHPPGEPQSIRGHW